MPNPRERDAFFRLLLTGKEGFNLRDFLDNSSADAIVDIDTETGVFEIVYLLDGKYAYPPESALETYPALYEYAFDHVIHPDDREIFASVMDPKGMVERLEKSPLRHFLYGNYRYRLQNGAYHYTEQALLMGEENGLPKNHVRFYILDVDNRYKRDSRVNKYIEDKKSLRRDPTTKLFEERSFIKEASRTIKAHSGKPWCIVCLDVEHFKFFDEWFGRQKGDTILTEIGAILQDHRGENGIAGYLGSDDFVLLTYFDKENITAIFEKIREAIINLGSSFGFMPAVGVCLYDGKVEIREMIDRASIASQQAKKDIRNRIRLYDPKMHEQTETELRILNEFMNALSEGEITFYLQPQCRISSHKVVGAEVLARWVKKDGKMVMPLDFIPVLEKYGFIIDMDKYIWEDVVKKMKDRLDKGLPVVPASINVSRADIFSIDVAKHFHDLTEKYGLPHDYLKIEITESAYMETEEKIAELVKNLRADGFRVLMDDFGSGYSSLNMLSTIALDAIKLDAGFLNIKGEEKETEKAIRILESVINMAKQIAIPIIVEGVETKEEIDFLDGLGCRYVQGYYFYRPMKQEDFTELIEKPGMIDPRGFVVKANEEFRIREFLDANVYSDAMLNNIPGAVALYSYKGDNIDIVRFNEQFYSSVDVPDFHEKLCSIQNVVPEEDRPRLYELLDKAVENRLGGSSGRLRFYKIDGTLTDFNMRFYYLGEKEDGKRFYGIANNITDLTDKEQMLKEICNYSSATMAFGRIRNDTLEFSVVSFGLADFFGLTTKELEKELNDFSFIERIDEKNRPNARKIAEEVANGNEEISYECLVKGKNEEAPFRIRLIPLREHANNLHLLSILEKLN